MGVGEWFRHLFGGEQVTLDSESIARENIIREQIRHRCLQFRHLLRANKRTLEWIGDIEEHLAGDKAFGMNYIRASSAEVVANVFKMIRALNALSNNQYADLHEAFDRIREKLTPHLTPVWHGQEGPYILPLTDIGLSDLSQVGGKMANLGEIVSHAGLKVPAGFVVTVAGYRRFMMYNDLGVELSQCIQSGTMSNMNGLLALAQQLQQKILKATLPDDLRTAIETAVNEICSGQDNIRLAVRSSAVGEDSLGASFAGQYRTEINVHPDEVCDVWKEIIASKYTTSALSYRYQRGIPDEDAPMGVGVLAMVDAKVGGVSYSRDPLENRLEERIVVNAVHGLPAAVVDGGVTPDAYICSHHNPPTLVASKLNDSKNPALSSDQACQVARVTLALEEYYAEPQDVEWAIDQNDALIILQSRPLHRNSPGIASSPLADFPKPEAEAVLAQGGVPVSAGVACGSAHVVRKDADMLTFPEKAILVIARAHPRWAALLPHAAGVISESGGVAGHLASVAREYGIPALFSLPDACSLLSDATNITLDATGGIVYKGDQTQLLPCTPSKQSFMHGSPIWERMYALSRHIVPLNLLDPNSAEFSPAHCMTMHDITRFCHEKAVNILFAQGDSDTLDSTLVGKQLKAGSKLQYWLVDMGGGFSHPISGATVGLGEIASKPMLALWEGMVSVPWNGPPVAGASGFMSIVLESTMNPELESALASPMGERNFFIIDAEYMILQARYGYHFCTVECQAGPQSHENFLSFQFKGGAADRERRFLRLQLFSELLGQRHFKVDIKDDALFAVAEDFDAGQTLRLTRLLGYLLIHSRQSDIIMKDVERVSLFRKKLLRDMEWVDRRPLTLA